VKETTDWIDENGSSASVEDLEEKLAGAYLVSLPSEHHWLLTALIVITEVQSVVNPITSKLYSSGPGGDSGAPGDDPLRDHDEL
jgi:heat shock protein 5